MANNGGDGPDGSVQQGPPAPEQIDRYRVKRRLGRGGQASVYLAYDPNLDIDVAVKLLDSREGDREFTERFRTEARAAVRLTHPHIVRVFDYNPTFPYIVMEYCDGGDLTEQIKRRQPRKLHDILVLVRQVCEALAVAHDNVPPILHRDLKPANVLFQRGEPKVADFGLAKMLGDEQALTTLRGMMGTIRYMSPEQCHDASQVDQRSDLWSLGVILYELLSWTRPFDKPGDSFVNIALKIRLEEARDLPFDVPAPVHAVLERALSKPRSARFETAREMIAAIDGALSALGDDAAALFPPEAAVDELDRLAAEGARLLDDGEAQRAESVISELKRRAPDHSLGPYWMKRLRTLHSSSALGSSEQRLALRLGRELDEVESLRAEGDLSAASKIVEKVIHQDPENSVAARLRDRIARELHERESGGTPDSEVPGLSEVVLDRALNERVLTARATLLSRVEEADTALEVVDAEAGSELDGARIALDAVRGEALRVLALPVAGVEGAERLEREATRLMSALVACSEAKERDESALALALADANSAARASLARVERIPDRLLEGRGSESRDLRTRIGDALRAAEASRGGARRAACATLRALDVESRGLLRVVDLETRDRLTEILERGAGAYESWPENGLLQELEKCAALTRSAEAGLEDLVEAEQVLEQAVASARASAARTLSEAQSLLDEMRRSQSGVASLSQTAREQVSGITDRLSLALEQGRAADAAACLQSAHAIVRALELGKRWAAVEPRIAEIETEEDPELCFDLLAPAEDDGLKAIRQGLAKGESQVLAQLPPDRSRPQPAATTTWVKVDGSAIENARARGVTRWMGPALLALLLLAVSLGVGWLVRPDGEGVVPLHPVFLVAPERDVNVLSASHGGESVPELEGRIDANGRTVGLAPGSYEIETDTGPRAFEVPGASTLVLTSRDNARWKALLDALDLGATEKSR